MADFARPPASVKLDLRPFTAHVDEQKLQGFRQLLKLSPIAPANFENSRNGRRYGVERDWLVQTKEHWLNTFDWRQQEARINAFPNFTAVVKDERGYDIRVHFIALFSRKPDAIPLAFYHGWPGSVLEFFQILELLTKRHTPDDLPYHVIVPSLVGYGYSDSPPMEYDFALEDCAAVMNNLMFGLGFGAGYLAQGGDLGSFVARHQVATFDACRGVHLNFSPMPRPSNADELPLSQVEQKALPRALWFRDQGMAYALEHGTRTATIGYALSASPLALLSWIAEKFFEWSDQEPSVDEILASVTLYWMTDTFPRGIYPYRGNSSDDETPKMTKISGKGRPRPPVEKPCGYSLFPKELLPMPVSWVATDTNLVHSNVHASGGHFAAMEKPQELLADVEEYIAKAWKAPGGGKL